MADTEITARIRDTARKDGFYLLPRRVGPPRLHESFLGASEVEYFACDALVDKGEAEWLPSFAPGIRLLRGRDG